MISMLLNPKLHGPFHLVQDVTKTQATEDVDVSPQGCGGSLNFQVKYVENDGTMIINRGDFGVCP